MKRLNSVFLPILLLAMVIASSCKKETDYPPLELGNSAAPTATLSHVADSLSETYTYVSVGSNMSGSVYYVALPAGSPAPTGSDLVLGNTSPAASGIAAEADASYMVMLSLESNSSYDVYAVAANSDEGKTGAVVGPVEVTTPDDTPPMVVGMTPGIGEEDVEPDVDEIVLEFNEAVTLVDVAGISVVDGFDESDLGIMGAVSVAGNMVTIEITDDIPYLTDVVVLIEAGTFTDVSGLESPEYTYEGDFYALYFTIKDILDMSNFLGAYRCYETDYAYSGAYEYDVLMFQADVYALEIVNVFDYGISGILEFDPVAGTCAFPDQPSGLSAGGDPLNLTSEDLIPGIVGYYPGSYNADGSGIYVSCWLYSPAFGDLYFASDFEFVKLDVSAAQVEQMLRDSEAKAKRALQPVMLR